MPAKATTKKAKDHQLVLPERFTIIESPETRTVIVGLHSNGSKDQRFITLREPNLVQLGQFQARGSKLDNEVPRPEAPADPEKPTGAELTAQRDKVLEQHEFIYGTKAGQPYGQLFLTLCNELSDQEVKAEDLPAWTAAPESSRRVLDFFKSPLPGPVDAEVLAAILQQAKS